MLQGRPEHTDSISHDGTWHYQLSGTKRWILRPTKQLLTQIKEQNQKEEDDGNDDDNNNNNDDDNDIENPPSSITIDCHEGDVLIVNTRLWFHQTFLPSQIEPSVSYARDFWIDPTRKHGGGLKNDISENGDNDDEEDEDGGNMTNMDGLYATDDIEQGTVIFTEKTMPDCELHRSKTNPNCEVVELEDGTQAVVSARKIACGEFFCIAESSDEEFEEEEEIDDDDDDEEYDEE